MTLRAAFRRTAVGLLLLSTGCTGASPGRDTLMSRMASLRPVDVADDAPPGQDEPDSEAEASSDQPLAESERADVHQASLSSARPARKMDAATLMLIQTELQDCTPVERDQWMSFLQSMDPAAVPQALQARRMQAARTAAATSGNSDPSLSGAGAAPPANGHSALNSPNAPRLDFETLEDASAFGSTGIASRLNAPEPQVSGESISGVSPFSRPTEREPSPPTLQTQHEELLSRNDAPSVTSAGFAPASVQQSAMPSITPNQAGAAPAVTPVVGPGYLEPSQGFDIAPGSNLPTGLPATDPLGATTLQGAYWQETLQRLTSLVEAEVQASHPGLSDQDRVAYIKRQVWLRMLYLMAEQPQRAHTAIPGLTPAEQEFWTALFWAVSNYFDTQTLSDPSERAASTLQQLDYAQTKLEQVAALQLSDVSFCYKINSFGNFESFQRDEFRPGQTVLVYAEVANFESRPQANGLYATRLKSFIEIRRGGADGEIIEQNSLTPTEDVCRTIRRDYFHSYTIDLPQHLTPGPYTLVLRIEDEFNGKSAVHPINFLIR
ncbi:MAG: hypothetical protein JNG89_12745 [Planctomycetaceae bacterium]|nr:hypothetical protein [Planctomycetaceae bacterium]